MINLVWIEHPFSIISCDNWTLDLRDIAGCGRDFAGVGLLAPASRINMQKFLRLCSVETKHGTAKSVKAAGIFHGQIEFLGDLGDEHETRRNDQSSRDLAGLISIIFGQGISFLS